MDTIKITADWLEKKSCCLEQRKIFMAEWPDGAEVTEENLWRALELKLDLKFFGKVFLPKNLYDNYMKKYVYSFDSHMPPILALNQKYYGDMARLKAEYAEIANLLEDERQVDLFPMKQAYANTEMSFAEYDSSLQWVRDKYSKKHNLIFEEFRTKAKPVEDEYTTRYEDLKEERLLSHNKNLIKSLLGTP